MIRRPPRSTPIKSSAASDVYKRQVSTQSTGFVLDMAEEHSNLVVIGTAGSGKSCITIRFVADRFVEEYEPTLEDSFRQQVEIDNKTSVLNIYDTAGVDEFPIVKDGYMREADGFLCVYAINAEESFEEVSKLHDWVMRVKENKPVPFVLCGNKSDLEDKRVISFEMGDQLAKSLNIIFMETSAKTGKNIEKAFTELVRGVRKHKQSSPSAPTQPASAPTKRESKCCLIL
eukprot:TRINITY_DN1045_c0_g1_i1.p1 TRINITY_DN1045_c0_g1~~TRINITY_DN1045_c0_g1_i1.p1  ORF type:complete len:230 (+),score=52.48 TRINITY_DN1045_c0_g1_i1:1-690(+)